MHLNSPSGLGSLTFCDLQFAVRCIKLPTDGQNMNEYEGIRAYIQAAS